MDDFMGVNYKVGPPKITTITRVYGTYDELLGVKNGNFFDVWRPHIVGGGQWIFPRISRSMGKLSSQEFSNPIIG